MEAVVQDSIGIMLNGVVCFGFCGLASAAKCVGLRDMGFRGLGLSE